MKKKFYYRLFLFVCVICLASCSKTITEEMPQQKIPEHKPCVIKTLKYVLPSSTASVTTEFIYNKWGDPDSIVSDLSTTGHPSRHVFNYDQRHRLVEYLSYYDNGSYQQWSRYYYNNKGQIISDTTYFFGTIIDGRPQPQDPFFLNSYTYDASGRIVQVAFTVNDLGPFFEGYQYDDRGNLVVGDLPYDDKVSIYRISRIWQFIGRNYSLNNLMFPPDLLVPEDYNKFGLPTRLSDGAGFLQVVASDWSIEYDCRSNADVN